MLVRNAIINIRNAIINIFVKCCNSDDLEADCMIWKKDLIFQGILKICREKKNQIQTYQIRVSVKFKFVSS